MPAKPSSLDCWAPSAFVSSKTRPLTTWCARAVLACAQTLISGPPSEITDANDACCPLITSTAAHAVLTNGSGSASDPGLKLCLQVYVAISPCCSENQAPSVAGLSLCRSPH